jgi:hypothetical protein
VFCADHGSLILKFLFCVHGQVALTHLFEVKQTHGPVSCFGDATIRGNNMYQSG